MPLGIPILNEVGIADSDTRRQAGYPKGTSIIPKECSLKGSCAPLSPHYYKKTEIYRISQVSFSCFAIEPINNRAKM